MSGVVPVTGVTVRYGKHGVSTKRDSSSGKGAGEDVCHTTGFEASEGEGRQVGEPQLYAQGAGMRHFPHHPDSGSCRLASSARLDRLPHLLCPLLGHTDAPLDLECAVVAAVASMAAGEEEEATDGQGAPLPPPPKVPATAALRHTGVVSAQHWSTGERLGQVSM
jgi:hypothetical protein